MQLQDTPPNGRPLSEDELLLVDEFRRAKVRQQAASVFSVPVAPYQQPQLAPTVIQPPIISQPYTNPPIQTPIENPEATEAIKRRRGWWIITGVNLLIVTIIINPGLNQAFENYLGLANAFQNINPPTPTLPPTQPLPTPQQPEELPTPSPTPSPPTPNPPVPSPPSPSVPKPPAPSPAPPQPNPNPAPPSQGGQGGPVTDADLARYILAYFRKNNWVVREGARRYNIAYIQTMDLDNTLNAGRYNAFDDARILFEVVNGQPRIVGKWQATTRPGDYYYRNPMNRKGTAHLQTRRQFRAWVMGVHRRGDHPALVQLGGPVTVLRTDGRPSTNTGDPPEGRPDIGYFGINQHGVVGQNMDRTDLQRASAGCLVAQNWSDHTQFIQYLRNDVDFVANSRYVWTTGVIPGRDILSR